MEIALGDILPFAVGVAISPVPIIAVILMLFTPRARSNGLAFLVGWVAGLAVVGAVVLGIAGTQDMSAESGPSTAAYVIRLLLGVLFLFLAYRNWQSRPKEGDVPEMPQWMAGIEAFTPVKALGLAALLSGVNPKNLSLTLAAAATIAQAGLTGADAVVALAVFIVIASLTVGVPVLYYLVGGESAQRTLDSWKTWLSANNATVMFVLLLVLGAKLIGDGIGGLAG